MELWFAFYRSLPLLAPSPIPSLSLPSHFPPLNPPCPARLDADLGSKFAHVLGQGRQAREKRRQDSDWNPETPSGGAEEGGGRRTEASLQFKF